MPKKKVSKPNGFILFCEDQKARMRREGRWDGSMPHLVALCKPGWEQLSEAEKDMYKERAKQEKASAAPRYVWVEDTPKEKDTRLDAAGERISDRVDHFQVERANRRKQREGVKRLWGPGKAVADEVFYMIDFLPLMEYDTNMWLPAELGLVEYSLVDGITNHMHIFVFPGPLPLGTLSQAMDECEEKHKLPHQDTETFIYCKDYRFIWARLIEFITTHTGRLPPLYTVAGNTQCVDYLLNLLSQWAGEPNRLAQKVYELEGLFEDLSAVANKLVPDYYEQVTFAEAADRLKSTDFDYDDSVCCKHHYSADCKVCALGSVRRWCYSLSADLCEIFDIQLTARHLPEVSEANSYVAGTFSETFHSQPTSAFPQQQRPAPNNDFSSSSRVNDMSGFGRSQKYTGEDSDGWEEVSSRRKVGRGGRPASSEKSAQWFPGQGTIGGGIGRGVSGLNATAAWGSAPAAQCTNDQNTQDLHQEQFSSEQLDQPHLGMNSTMAAVSTLSVSTHAVSPGGRGQGWSQPHGSQVGYQPAVVRGHILQQQSAPHGSTSVSHQPQESWATCMSHLTLQSSVGQRQPYVPSSQGGDFPAPRPAAPGATGAANVAAPGQPGKSWASLFSQPAAQHVRPIGSRGPPPGFGGPSPPQQMTGSTAPSATHQEQVASLVGGFGRGNALATDGPASNPWQASHARGRARGRIVHQPLRKPHGLSPMLQQEQRFQ